MPNIIECKAPQAPVQEAPPGAFFVGGKNWQANRPKAETVSPAGLGPNRAVVLSCQPDFSLKR